MTKRDWDKADQYRPDPGVVVEVPELTQPYRWVSPQERACKEAERTKEKRELGRRSEQRDQERAEAQLEHNIRKRQALGEPASGLEKLFLTSRKERG